MKLWIQHFAMKISLKKTNPRQIDRVAVCHVGCNRPARHPPAGDGIFAIKRQTVIIGNGGQTIVFGSSADCRLPPWCSAFFRDKRSPGFDRPQNGSYLHISAPPWTFISSLARTKSESYAERLHRPASGNPDDFGHRRPDAAGLSSPL